MKKVVGLCILMSSAGCACGSDEATVKKTISKKNIQSVSDVELSPDHYLTQQFQDKELQEKIVTVHLNPSSIIDIIELVGRSAGIDFIIDPLVSGEIGKLNFEQRKVGDILHVLCMRNSPRLALIKHLDVWHVMPYDKALIEAKKNCSEPMIQMVFALKRVRCTKELQVNIEDMWHRITKRRMHDKDFAEQAYCSVELESKKVFMRASRSVLREMSLFLQEIDCAVAQVRIDAIVVVVDSRYEHQLGFNWSGVYNRRSSVGSSFDMLGVGVAPQNSSSGTADNFALNLFTKATSALKLPILFGGSNLSLQHLNIELRAAEMQSKAKILLKPSVLTNHNETSEILIGKSVPIKTVVEDVAQGKVRNMETINYKDVGTILNVRPIVSPDRTSVMLDIWVEDSSIADSSHTERAPVIKTIRTKNKVNLHSGQTTVIGGLMLNRDEMSQSEMPILGKLPLLGIFFRGKQHTQEDNQLLIFITPTIVS